MADIDEERILHSCQLTTVDKRCNDVHDYSIHSKCFVAIYTNVRFTAKKINTYLKLLLDFCSAIFMYEKFQMPGEEKEDLNS